ncbi:caspase family protein [Ruegeria marina]|uniref:Caspase domain-containing protein n=1 Tax=Ruegeria marina TaxID=639004 RepID=A0A1G6Z8Q2_9RHOB|nr:caspase family protein [Ruegeria marina]SDD98265.1 Caspase domain-containing protein [Ruegeria marina]
MRTLVFAFLLSVLPTVLLAEKVALVIGNAAYEHVSPLANPTRDADAVSAALARQGFDVVIATDLTRSALYNTLRDFRDKADRADVAMVYYAGHGIEVGGQNYLIPVDARLSDERDADIEMIKMDAVLNQLSGAKKLKMVVLDACRDNPFVNKMKRENRGRNVGRGLALVSSAEAATLIAYAAAAGEVTPDGPDGRNSPFTSAFLAALDRPPSDVRILLGAVRDELSRTVPGAVPFVYSSLGAEQVIINPNSAQSEPERPQAAAAPAPAVQDEAQMLRDYAKAEFSGTVEAWEGFLEAYAGQSSHMLFILAQRARKQAEGAQIAALPSPSQAVRQSPETPADVPAVTVPSTAGPLADPAPPLLSREELKRDLQVALKDRGCYLSSIDGIWGRGSAAALSRFNRAAGTDLKLDTNSDPDLLAAVLERIERSDGVKCAAVRQAPKPARAAAAPKPSSNTPTAKPAPAAQAPEHAADSEPPKCRNKYGTLYGSDGGVNVGLPLCR